jgi:hypothetical protein
VTEDGACDCPGKKVFERESDQQCFIEQTQYACMGDLTDSLAAVEGHACEALESSCESSRAF